MRPLVDLLCDGTTRQRALETMLVAHLALDRTCLDGRRWPRLSSAGEALVDMMLVERIGDHGLLVPGTIFHLRFVRHLTVCMRNDPFFPEPEHIHLLQCTARARYRDVVRIAQRAEMLTVQELGFLSRDTVLAMLGATLKPRRKKSAGDRILELAEDAAA